LSTGFDDIVEGPCVTPAEKGWFDVDVVETCRDVCNDPLWESSVLISEAKEVDEEVGGWKAKKRRRKRAGRGEGGRLQRENVQRSTTIQSKAVQ
jgi:hypothetical protein